MRHIVLADVPKDPQLALGDNVVVKFFEGSTTLNTNYNPISLRRLQ